jgi:hypothetical protein
VVAEQCGVRAPPKFRAGVKTKRKSLGLLAKASPRFSFPSRLRAISLHTRYGFRGDSRATLTIIEIKSMCRPKVTAFRDDKKSA